MGFLEETAAKAKEVFEAGEKKATEVINIQKLKYEISQSGERLEKAYIELGKSVASKCEDERFAEFAENFKEIDAAKQQIARLREDLASAKGCESCPQCGCFAIKGAKFCSECGYKF